MVRVRGYQWWWEVDLCSTPQPDQDLTTANEIHIPVGRPVRIELAAADVIHSFWVPNLAGKQDLIPGRDNRSDLHRRRSPASIAASAPSSAACSTPIWRCWSSPSRPTRSSAGATHSSRRPRPPDTRRSKRRAARLSAGKACAACHTVRGTAAAGTLGPGPHPCRRAGSTIAAGMLPTTRGSLAAWIADPQTIKPGNNMPMVPLTADELQRRLGLSGEPEMSRGADDRTARHRATRDLDPDALDAGSSDLGAHRRA